MRSYDSLVLFVDSTAMVLVWFSTRRVFVLGSSLPPVLVNPVLELDDGEIADLERERLVEEDGLQSCQYTS